MLLVSDDANGIKLIHVVKFFLRRAWWAIKRKRSITGVVKNQ